MDVICERVFQLPTSQLTRRLIVFDKDDLTKLVPPPQDPGSGPNVIGQLIREVLRQAANFPVVVIRGDWLLGVVAVQDIHRMLYQLFVESNKPQPPTGPKQWSFKLTPEQRRLLTALPVPQPTADSVLPARTAALALFLQEAPKMASESGAAWPDELTDAVVGYLRDQGLDVPIGSE